MKRTLSYLLLAMSGLMTGCLERASVPEDGGMSMMGFDMEMGATKGLVTPENLAAAGSMFVINDVHSRTSPSDEDQSETGLVQYLDDQYLEFRDGQWRFTDVKGGEVIDIPWTKKGTHSFLAYNVYDAASFKELPVEVAYSSFEDEPSYGHDGQYLRIPANGDWTIDMTSQFDFIYASAYRDVRTGGYAPVSMGFKHLFAAVSVEIRNISSSQVTLNSLSFSNLKDEGNALVDYQGNVTVSKSSSVSEGQFKVPSSSKSLGTGASVSLYSSLGAGEAFLIWPHSRDEFADVSIEMNYRQGNTQYDKTIRLSESYSVTSWTAGNRYSYLITISDNYISFDVVRVVDWINDDIILEE